MIGTFIGLLWATASTQEEAQSYKEKLEGYRWTLRLSSKSAEILDRAASLLATSTGALVKGIPEKGSSDSQDDSKTVESAGDEDDLDDVSRGNSWAPEHSLTDDLSMQASPTQYSEGALEMFWQGLPLAQTNYDVSGSYDHVAEDDVHHFIGADGDLRGY